MVNIVLDCMGGEGSSQDLIRGALMALDENENINLILVGKYEKYKFELNENRFDKNRIQFVDANDVIYGNDEPVKTLKTKKNSSLVVSLNELLKKNYDAIVSTGNTGAFLAGCIFLVGRIDGISRPALAPIINGENEFILLDAGANVDCKVDDFLSFAKIGSIYYEILFNKLNPIVKLLNIGEENNKGNYIVKKAYDELFKLNDINFKGNIEARYLMSDNANIVVCDGFVGNIALKTLEGTSKYLISKLKKDINNSFFYKIGSKIFFNNFKNIREKYNYKKYGGATFLGVEKICIKAHGNSNCYSIKNSINLAYKLSSNNFIDNFKKRLFKK